MGVAGYSLRKRWERVRWGGIGWWRLGHGVIGVLALIALIAHTGLRVGTGFNRVLITLFLASSVLGAAAAMGLGGRHARKTFWLHVLAAWPLPAQMFRMGAELAAEMTDVFSYALLSSWPINSSNAPRTAMETEGLESVATGASTPFYGTETLGGVDYFTAVYADVAVSQACVNCHNGHRDSPRDDFELGETMGGIVIRIPLNRMN